MVEAAAVAVVQAHSVVHLVDHLVVRWPEQVDSQEESVACKVVVVEKVVDHCFLVADRLG